MLFNDVTGIVLRNLKRRKGRTFLTSLGVTIGTTFIVTMLSLGIGLQNVVMDSVSTAGDFTQIEVYPGFDYRNPENMVPLDKILASNLRLIDGVQGVKPQKSFNSGVELNYQKKYTNVQVTGVDVKDIDAFDIKLKEGSYLSGSLNECVISSKLTSRLTERKKGSNSREKVVVLGLDGKEQEDSGINLLNKNISLRVYKADSENRNSFRDFNIRVVGILSEDASGWGNDDTQIYVPIEKVNEIEKWSGIGNRYSSKKSKGQKNNEYYDTIAVKAKDMDSVDKVENAIKEMGYNASSLKSSLKEINQIFTILQAALGGIGGISLIISSLGIINTMVMSIMERTREIGIMKVIGATIPDVKNLFLFEAGSIGLIGGVCGLLISFVLSFAINTIVKMLPQMQEFKDKLGNFSVIPIWLCVAVILFSVLVGTLAGIYPAMRAAKLEALDAIKYE